MPDLFAKHETRAIRIRLPLPPSVNHAHAIFTPKPARGQPFDAQKHRSRIVLSAAGKAFQVAVARCWNSSRSATPWEPLTGPLRVTARIHYVDRRKIDLDNRVKPLLDALTQCGAWGDDSQIDELHVFRGPVAPPAGFCDVTIEAITP